MKKLVVIIGVLSLLVGCSKPNVEQEKSNAEATVKNFYAAIEKTDFDSLATFCTTTFTGFEQGYTFPDVKDLANLFKSFNIKSGNINVSFLKTEVIGDMAYIVLNAEGAFNTGQSSFSVKSHENFILKKENNKWLIQYFHSTHLPDVNDKNLISVHLIKLNENMPIIKVEEAIAKLNSVVSSLGYIDCGYKVLTVLPNPKSEYNCLITANWKNQEIYKIIHESDFFKKVAEETSKELIDIFNNEIYVKASLPE